MTPRETMRLIPGGIDEATGEVADDAPSYHDLAIQNDKLKNHIAKALMDVGKAEAKHRRAEEKKAAAPAIREVLIDWRDLCAERPKSVKITANGERWKKVAERLTDKDVLTGDLAFSVADLKYAIRGALLSKYHRDNDYLDAESIFRNPDRVNKHVKRYWDWAFTPQGEEHCFKRVQKWLRQNGAEGFADALLGDRLEETLVIERAA